MLFPAPVEIVWESKPQKHEERLINIANRLSTLDTGMTFEELYNLTQTIETLRKSKKHPTLYLRKEDTQAPRTIEIDPVANRIFVHLKTHNLPEVGRGSHKRVTRSILYDPINPKLVATAIVKDTKETDKEIEALKKFQGSQYIIEPIFISKHTKKSGRVCREIITPLYNKGSLNSFIKHNRHNIPIKTKYKIAKDILHGSCEINAVGYVNRDNNKGNFFIHEENGIARVVIGDLGGYTSELAVALKHKPLGPTLRSSPADLQLAYYEDRLTEQDLLSHHVYSLGRALYFLLFEKEVPWIADFNITFPLLKNLYKDKSNPDLLLEINRFATRTQANTRPRIEELSKKGDPLKLSAHEHFEYCVLNMLCDDPSLRKTNTYWLKIFEKFELTKE